MRIVIESKRILVVEAEGRVVPTFYFALIFLYALALSQVLDFHDRVLSASMIVFSIAACCLLGYFAFGAMRDVLTVTFDGVKHLVSIEHKFPFEKIHKSEIPFDSFRQFEVAEPSDGGFCRIRTKKDKTRLLFKIGKHDVFAPLIHLDMITRKQTEIIRKTGP